jgi:hypothetical protein
LKVVTGFNTPVYKSITVKEICGKSVVTAPSGDIAMEAAETNTGTVDTH